MESFKKSELKNSSYFVESLTENGTRQLRVDIPKDSLRMIHFKNQVYTNYMYLTSLSEMDNISNKINRYVYYNLNTKQQVLDDVRVHLGTESLDEQRVMRDRFMVGLLSIFYLVSKGKIYNVPINPLNFIFENDRKVKAFYRQDRELGEITDDWLMDFKKLLAYYLIFDTSIIPENFNNYSIQEYVEKMNQSVQHGFKKFYNCSSIDEMLPLLLKEDEIKALTYSYPLDDEFNEPTDLSSGIPLDFDTAIVNATYIETEDKESLKQKLLDEKVLDKSKVRKADKKRKERERLAKKREREESRNQNKIKQGYEPNEAKRNANSHNKGFKQGKISIIPLIFFIIITVIVGLVVYSKFTGKPVTEMFSKPKQEVGLNYAPDPEYLSKLEVR